MFFILIPGHESEYLIFQVWRKEHGGPLEIPDMYTGPLKVHSFVPSFLQQIFIEGILCDRNSSMHILL